MDQTDPLFSPIIRDLNDNYGGVSFENFADMILEKGSFKANIIMEVKFAFRGMNYSTNAKDQWLNQI